MTNRPPDQPDDDRGEYGLGPEPTPGPRWVPPRPIRVAKLEYQVQPTASVASVPTGVQFVIGMISPYAYFIATGAIISLLPGSIGGFAFLIGLAGFVALVALVRIRGQWTGFLPGVLVAAFVLPIVAILACGLLLAGSGFVLNMH